MRKICLLLLALSLLTACGEKAAEEEVSSEPSGSVTMQSGEAASAVSEAPAVPFTEHTVEIKGEDARFMVILRRGDRDNEISVTVENNLYESRKFKITAPAGFRPIIPADRSRSSRIVNIIKNDIDDTYIPDIMQFNFESEQENGTAALSAMYIIDSSGELRRLKIINLTDRNADGIYTETSSEYLDRTQLYHSEPRKFIYEITVDAGSLYDEWGEPVPPVTGVKIKTLTFDSKALTLSAGFETIDESNPLYFGYACWAAANSAARFFNVATFNISDWNNYIEVPSADDSTLTDYYFKIDDSRFHSTDDLKKYLERFFTPALAERIFNSAPQRYTDIDGELYAAAGDGVYDSSLGTLTFSGMDITENRMVFRSRQEKYDSTGGFSGYTDGGTFVIERNSEGVWKVSSYRYPYSFS